MFALYRWCSGLNINLQEQKHFKWIVRPLCWKTKKVWKSFLFLSVITRYVKQIFLVEYFITTICSDRIWPILVYIGHRILISILIFNFLPAGFVVFINLNYVFFYFRINYSHVCSFYKCLRWMYNFFYACNRIFSWVHLFYLRSAEIRAW